MKAEDIENTVVEGLKVRGNTKEIENKTAISTGRNKLTAILTDMVEIRSFK